MRGLMNKQHPSWRRAGMMLAAAAGIVAAGCEVTNPGPINDDFLDLKSSHQALVKGAERRLMDGLLRTAYSAVAMTTREVFPGGDSNSNHPRIQAGALPEGNSTGDWNDLQQARFIADDALRRFAKPEVAKDVDPKLAAQAHIWAGYALRVLGENFCQSVIDGGPLQSTTVGFQAAEKHFTDALAIAGITDDQKNQAYAGRAQTRLALKNWAGAADDASKVPLSFVLNLTPDATQEPTRNYAGYYNDNTPYRVFTMKHTFFEDYYTQTGDPRVPWRTDPKFPFAGSRLTGYTLTPTGSVPWLQLMAPGATTHYNPGTPIALARGTEMRLIQAEAALMQNPASFPQALTLINQARTFYTSLTTKRPLDPYAANTNAAVWTALKTERHIDGFMQAKRLFDIFRWTRDNTPGTYPWPNWEPLSSIFRSETPWSTYRGADNQKGICIQVPNSERLANPNIPDDLVL